LPIGEDDKMLLRKQYKCLLKNLKVYSSNFAHGKNNYEAADNGDVLQFIKKLIVIQERYSSGFKNKCCTKQLEIDSTKKYFQTF
jgi:hypothetical protein